MSLDHRGYTWCASVCTIGEKTLKSSKLPAFPCPVTDEILSASLRARACPTNVFECFFHPLAALELAATVILSAFGMKEIQLPHCHSIPDPNLIRGELVFMIPEMSWRLL